MVYVSAWHYLHKYSSYLPPGTLLCRTLQQSDLHARSPTSQQWKRKAMKSLFWEVKKNLEKDKDRERILTKETTLFVITPPNKLFTVFFCEWINKFCQGNLSKSVSFQASFCSFLITHQFWRHFFYFCYQVSEEFCHIFLLSSVQWLLIHGIGFTERPWIICLTFTFL